MSCFGIIINSFLPIPYAFYSALCFCSISFINIFIRFLSHQTYDFAETRPQAYFAVSRSSLYIHIYIYIYIHIYIHMYTRIAGIRKGYLLQLIIPYPGKRIGKKCSLRVHEAHDWSYTGIVLPGHSWTWHLLYWQGIENMVIMAQGPPYRHLGGYMRHSIQMKNAYAGFIGKLFQYFYHFSTQLWRIYFIHRCFGLHIQANYHQLVRIRW